MNEIKIECEVDITGSSQHGFKKSKSTETAGLVIQSLITRALDRGEYSIMASVDLPAAFDVVNSDLLIRRHQTRLIKPYFAASELKQIITSNFYLILYYNSNIWHLPTLSPLLKQKLLSASGNALKLCTPYCFQDISFITLHCQNCRATPDQMLKYKLLIQLYKTFNTQQPPLEWAALNDSICTGRRQILFETLDVSSTKVGKSLLSNRFKVLNKSIPLTWLNQSLDTFKAKCKSKFMPN